MDIKCNVSEITKTVETGKVMVTSFKFDICFDMAQ